MPLEEMVYKKTIISNNFSTYYNLDYVEFSAASISERTTSDPVTLPDLNGCKAEALFMTLSFACASPLNANFMWKNDDQYIGNQDITVLSAPDFGNSFYKDFQTDSTATLINQGSSICAQLDPEDNTITDVVFRLYFAYPRV